jgi:SNF2 family DNA or RNA helicase
MKVLDANQQEAIKKLSQLKVGAAFMHMGTGKTLTAFELIASTNVELCLWIGPLSVIGEIKKEYVKWGHTFPIEFVGCESISQSDRIYYDLLRRIQNKNIFCVVDESLTIKNFEAIRTKRIIEIGTHCTYRLILNGIPISKNYIDLWAQMEFLSPKILNMSFRKFKDNFAEYYVRGRLKGMIRKYHNIDYLMKLISPYIYACDLELNIQEYNYDYYYDNEFDDEYREIKKELLHDSRPFDLMALFTMLQKCYTKSAARDDIINQITENGEQFIVYCKFLDNIKGDNKITGDVEKEERKRIRTRFENKEFNVLWITYGCGSYGLNMQFCNNIIFADQNFDYGRKIQAAHRVKRKGQTRFINYYNLWCRTGLENMIKSSNEKKLNMITEVKKALKKYGEKAVIESL